VNCKDGCSVSRFDRHASGYADLKNMRAQIGGFPGKGLVLQIQVANKTDAAVPYKSHLPGLGQKNTAGFIKIDLSWFFTFGKFSPIVLNMNQR